MHHSGSQACGHRSVPPTSVLHLWPSFPLLQTESLHGGARHAVPGEAVPLSEDSHRVHWRLRLAAPSLQNRTGERERPMLMSPGARPAMDSRVTATESSGLQTERPQAQVVYARDTPPQRRYHHNGSENGPLLQTESLHGGARDALPGEAVPHSHRVHWRLRLAAPSLQNRTGERERPPLMSPGARPAVDSRVTATESVGSQTEGPHAEVARDTPPPRRYRSSALSRLPPITTCASAGVVQRGGRHSAEKHRLNLFHLRNHTNEEFSGPEMAIDARLR